MSKEKNLRACILTVSLLGSLSAIAVLGYSRWHTIVHVVVDNDHSQMPYSLAREVATNATPSALICPKRNSSSYTSLDLAEKSAQISNETDVQSKSIPSRLVLISAGHQGSNFLTVLLRNVIVGAVDIIEPFFGAAFQGDLTQRRLHDVALQCLLLCRHCNKLLPNAHWKARITDMCRNGEHSQNATVVMKVVRLFDVIRLLNLMPADALSQHKYVLLARDPRSWTYSATANIFMHDAAIGGCHVILRQALSFKQFAQCIGTEHGRILFYEEWSSNFRVLEDFMDWVCSNFPCSGKAKKHHLFAIKKDIHARLESVFRNPTIKWLNGSVANVNKKLVSESARWCPEYMQSLGYSKLNTTLSTNMSSLESRKKLDEVREKLHHGYSNLDNLLLVPFSEQEASMLKKLTKVRYGVKGIR